MRFLVDENLPPGLVEALRATGHDVLWVPRSPLRGATDAAIARTAIDEDRVVVTRDLGFPPMALAGLVLVRLPDGFLGDQITRRVTQALETSAENEIRGHITVISPTGTRSRTLEDA